MVLSPILYKTAKHKCTLAHTPNTHMDFDAQVCKSNADFLTQSNGDHMTTSLPIAMATTAPLLRQQLQSATTSRKTFVHVQSHYIFRLMLFFRVIRSSLSRSRGAWCFSFSVMHM